MSSLRLPPNLLHGTTEPQWFSRSEIQQGSTTSRLQALEIAELKYTEQLRTQVLPPAPEPIGLGDGGASVEAHKPLLPEMQVLPQHTPSFWTQHQATVESMRAERRQVPLSADVATTIHNSGSSSSSTIGSPSCLTSPTSRTG